MDPECVGVQFLPPELVAPLDARTAAVLDACLQAPSVAAAAQYRAAQLTDVLGEVQCRARVRVQTPLVDLGAAALAPLRAAVTQVALAPGQFRTGLRWNAVYHPDVLRVLEAVLQPDDERGVPARDAGTTLAVLGNDFLLRLVAGACLHLCAARGDDAAPLRDARFCLVPAPACRFAERLAARDPAYRTHVVDSLRYLTSVCPRVAAASSSTVALQQQQQQQRKRMGVRAVASDAMDGGCALPNPAACAAMLVESFCADAPCTLAVPVTVCQCDDLQRRTCHAHVFFAQCAVSSQMEKQQPAAAKQAFNVALAYDVVAPDGTTQHVAETRKIASATLSRPVAKLFRMDLVLATEEDSVCVFPLPQFALVCSLGADATTTTTTAKGQDTAGSPGEQRGHEHQRREQGPLCHRRRPAVRPVHAPPLCPHARHHALCTLPPHLIKQQHHHRHDHQQCVSQSVVFRVSCCVSE